MGLSQIYHPTDVGRTLFVDGVNGNDSSAEPFNRDRPYLTLAAAKAAAISGNLIYVWPGSYTVAESLAKNEVNWNFEPGTTVTRTDTDPSGIWDDGGEAMTFVVAGHGTFIRTPVSNPSESVIPCIGMTNADSVAEIEGLDFENSDPVATSPLIYQTAGSLRVIGRDFRNTSSTTDFLCHWQNGQLSINGRICYGSLWVDVQNTPTGEMHVEFEEYSPPINYTLYDTSTDSTAAVWIRGDIVQPGISGTTMLKQGVARVYFECQKILGQLIDGSSSGGLLYLRADKASDLTVTFANGAVQGWLQINDWENSRISTSNAGTIINVFGGAMRDGGSPINIVAGTIRLFGVRIDTSAFASGNPVTKSGGTLELYNCTLISHSSRDSIEATGAQSVAVRGSLSINTAVDSNVTLSSGIAIRTDTGAVTATSHYSTKKNVAPADADIAAGELTWWFDSTNGAAKAMFKGKSANGTVVTGNVPLT